MVKVGLPAESKKLPPICLDRMNTLWMFSGMLAPSTARPYWLPWVSFLPSATSSLQVVGGLAMPAAWNSALL